VNIRLSFVVTEHGFCIKLQEQLRQDLLADELRKVSNLLVALCLTQVCFEFIFICMTLSFLRSAWLLLLVVKWGILQMHTHPYETCR